MNNATNPIRRVSVLSTARCRSIPITKPLPGAGDPALAPFRSGHDLFGDGSLVLLPTPGHTLGSLSLLVRPHRPVQRRLHRPRNAVAVAATELLVRIAEHLDQEEREVLPLIDRYLTEKEWQQVGGSGLKKMSFGQLKVAFGMILDDAGPEQVKVMRDTIPLAPWTLFSLTGPRAYAKYARRLHSADVPALPAAA